MVTDVITRVLKRWKREAREQRRRYGDRHRSWGEAIAGRNVSGL